MYNNILYVLQLLSKFYILTWNKNKHEKNSNPFNS